MWVGMLVPEADMRENPVVIEDDVLLPGLSRQPAQMATLFPQS